jgi:predicted ATPase
LAGLLPEIELKLQQLPPGPGLAPEQARLRLFDAEADFLRAIAAPRPAVLLLDDLHSATLDLIVHVARRDRSAPLVIVAAYRPGDAPVNSALQRTLAELGRLRLLVATLVSRPCQSQRPASWARASFEAECTTISRRSCG